MVMNGGGMVVHGGKWWLMVNAGWLSTVVVEGRRHSVYWQLMFIMLVAGDL